MPSGCKGDALSSLAPLPPLTNYTSALFDMSINEGAQRGAFNCWVQMPFQKHARLQLVNESDTDVRIFYYVDHQPWDELPDNAYNFHASWHCEMPCEAVPLVDGKEGSNLTSDENYVILNTGGEGTYIGCNLSIDNHAGRWWGEGDDIIFIDGEPFQLLSLCWNLTLQPRPRKVGRPMDRLSPPRARPHPLQKKHSCHH
jgi:hypothetical protein